MRLFKSTDYLALIAMSLDTLSYDVFYQIATLLDDCDFINLSRTSRALYHLSRSEQIARKTVEVSQASPSLELQG